MSTEKGGPDDQSRRDLTASGRLKAGFESAFGRVFAGHLRRHRDHAQPGVVRIPGRVGARTMSRRRGGVRGG